MGNGVQLSPGKIIAISVSACLGINGIGVSFTIDAMNRQESAMKALAEKVDTKMDDRYRRWEADEAHRGINQRFNRVERRDAIIESKLDGHVTEDSQIHGDQ